jgi:hypothetical protein
MQGEFSPKLLVPSTLPQRSPHQNPDTPIIDAVRPDCLSLTEIGGGAGVAHTLDRRRHDEDVSNLFG